MTLRIKEALAAAPVSYTHLDVYKRQMLDAVENGRIEAVMVRDLEQISRNSYILVGVIEILRQNDVYLITTECDLNAELINSGLERFVGDRFTRASFGKPRFDVRLPLMDQF